MTPKLPSGFAFAGVRCGLKNKRNDLGLLVSDRPALAAGVLTTNYVRASSVDYTRSILADGKLRAIVVNSGNANCATGEQGARDTATMAELTAAALEISADHVAVASTGIIGQPLDMAKVTAGITSASKVLSDNPVPFMDAILTTDLVEKQAWAALESGASVYGVAKGSGMIAPNMATMLAFLVTDADAEGIDLQGMLQRVANRTFNCLTIDGDTSTNDMLLVMANGSAGKGDPADLEAAIEAVCLSLAKQVARDGEGATKLVEVIVHGSENPKAIARSIADSPLVKTAMFGCDPNWGRILMAAGKAGVPFDIANVSLSLEVQDQLHLLFEAGKPVAFDPKRVSAALKADHVRINLALGPGPSATIYTCDLGYGYVRINAEYHT